MSLLCSGTAAYWYGAEGEEIHSNLWLIIIRFVYYSAAQGTQDTVTGFLLLHDISPVDYAIPRVAIIYLSPTYHLSITILGQSEAFLRRPFSISFFSGIFLKNIYWCFLWKWSFENIQLSVVREEEEEQGHHHQHGHHPQQAGEWRSSGQRDWI